MTGAAIADRFFEAGAATESIFMPEPAQQAKKLFSFTGFDEAAASALTTASRPLVKGVLTQGAMTVLYGDSNAGKTFVAMDVANHVARGAAWAGKRVTQFPVLYVAAEGGQGARLRTAALFNRYGSAPDFKMLLHPINLLRADADLVPLIESVRACGVAFGLVVIDTLSRAMAGGDENASTDMGAMVKHLDALRQATGAHLMVVHHSGKDRAKGARGHSLLRAATDTEIEVVNREIVVTKQRDLDGTFSRGFDLDVLTLGVDADGDPITSCTVRLLRGDEVATGTATPREADVLKAVDALDGMDGKTGVSLADLAAHFDTAAERMSKDTVRFNLKSLIAKNLVSRVGHGKYAKKAEEKAPSVSDAERFFNDDAEESGGQTEENVFD
jgi:hypothetical protein